MSIIQFLRILWARAPLIVACTVFTFLGGLVVTLVVQPRYEATARVMLNILRKDPLTGAAQNINDLGPFIDTQRELIKDFRVAGPVVTALNWETDPQKIAAYQSRPAADNRDFKHWLAQGISDRTNARFVSGTIFEISFSSPYPLEAKTGAEALRQSFMDYTLVAKRQDATKTAQWFL
ncbi:MAG: Wzz/FepE/Etk N-terminal domain-containing protein, partial [Phenylobacterium sp.]